MGLNTIRLEGKLENDRNFFDLADQQGILVHGGMVLLRFLGALAELGQPKDFEIAEAVAARSDRRLRSHPSRSSCG